MSLDRDLRDALQPLAGDPVADAARVLGALPPGPPTTGPARPWLPWTLLSVGLVLGLAIGRATISPASPSPASGPTNQPAEGAAKPTSTDQQPDDPRAETKKEDQPVVDPGFLSGNRMEGELMLMAFGPIDIDEPKEGRQQLKEGSWTVHAGTRFQTGKGQIGIYVYRSDARVRLDFDTEARVDADGLQLSFGRAWLDTGSRRATLTIDCGPVKLAMAQASAVIARKPSGVEVLALAGKPVVTTATDTIQLLPQERLFVDTDRGPEPKAQVPFTAPATSWMTTMIQMGSDPAELSNRIRDVVGAYEQGEFRAAARREILKLGAGCVWLLVDSIERSIGKDRDYALATAQLLARIVDYRSAAYALPLLLQDDAELRETVFRGVRDATGTDGGSSEDFWRTAPRDERRPVVEKWQYELQR